MISYAANHGMQGKAVCKNLFAQSQDNLEKYQCKICEKCLNIKKGNFVCSIKKT